MSTNPFQDNQNTTGAKAGFGAFESLRIDKEYDDETLKANPGAPLPAPAGTVPEFLDARNNVNARDYEGEQLQKFRDFKKSSEALDDILEREYIDPINAKKQQIVDKMTNAFNVIDGASDPVTNVRLITSPAAAPDTEVVYPTLAGGTGQVGIEAFVYATATGPVDILGVRGEIFPDILAAYHYPNLSDNNHGDSDLPLAGGQFTRVSRTIPRQKEYASSTLGIGETVYHSGDNDYSGAVGVVTSQSSLGYFYFFGGTEDSNGVGANINNVSSGAQSEISNLITEIKDLRTSLRIRIGPPHTNTSAGINTLRESKHRDELEVWYDEAGNRTKNIVDFQGGMDSLVGNATSISQYNG